MRIGQFRSPCLIALAIWTTAAILLLGCNSEATRPEATPSATAGTESAGPSADAGEAEASPPEALADESQAGRHGESGPARDEVNVSLRAVDEKQFAEVLARYRGQVVLVDFWATWCPPCVELFPHTVQLHRALGNQGLAVISFSMDDPSSRETVEAFLQEQGATSENLISAYGLGPKSFEAFQITDGALPHLRLYDRQGEVAETFALEPDKLKPDYIEETVRQVLAGPAANR